MADWPMPDGSVYVGARTVETDDTTFVPKELGAINGGLVLRNDMAKVPSFAIHVPSIDDYIKRLESAGGKLLKEKQNVEVVIMPMFKTPKATRLVYGRILKFNSSKFHLLR